MEKGLVDLPSRPGDVSSVLGFLEFTMGNLMPLPPIQNRMLDHTLK